MKKSYLLLADGFEEIEAIGTLDILRRAGMDLLTVSINAGYEVTGAHGVTVKADIVMNSEMGEPDWIILPGGMPGASNLADDSRVREMLMKQNNIQGNIAAICAAPAVVLAPLGILDGLDATCYPGFEAGCSKSKVKGERVAVTERIITAKGPGCTFEFAMAIVEKAFGKDTAARIMSEMIM